MECQANCLEIQIKRLYIGIIMISGGYMNQDFMTKSARPLITIAGMLMFALNYTVGPFIFRFMGKDSTPLEIPSEWIIGYFAVVGVYSLGRSAEKLLNLKTDQNSNKEKVNEVNKE